jgi:hypothetical protein
MIKPVAFLTACAAALVLAGCSTSGSNPIAPSRVCNLAANVLQLNVGTANLFGDTPAAAVAGTNVAVTYRQSASANCFVGNSGTLVNSPTLTRPAVLAAPAGTPDSFLSTILGGPDPSEIGHTSMTSTPQTPNAANTTTFGVDGGAFGLGLEPFNISSVSGQPDNVVPYPVPLYDPIVAGGGANPNAFTPGGGPPAFNIAGNQAAVLAGFNAISEGLDVFAIAPAVGAYSLTISVPANTGTVTSTASATLSSAALLPAFVSPVPVVAANGSVTAPVVLPAGVTEAYVQIVDFGPTATDSSGTQRKSCVGAGSGSKTSSGVPVYYTVVIKASGTATFPAPTICTAAQNTTANSAASDGDAFTVQGIGFDYGAFEASYPTSLGVAAPSLAGAGASHQSDVTISSQGLYNLPVGGGPMINGAGGAVLPANAKHVGGASKVRA